MYVHIESHSTNEMANERTFLAWIRSALGFLTVCVGFIQFYRLEMKSTIAELDGVTYHLPKDKHTRIMERFGKPIGILFALLLLVSLVFGTVRYYQVQMLLTRDHFPATRVTVGVVILMNVAVVALLLVVNIGIFS